MRCTLALFCRSRSERTSPRGVVRPWLRLSLANCFDRPAAIQNYVRNAQFALELYEYGRIIELQLAIEHAQVLFDVPETSFAPFHERLEGPATSLLLNAATRTRASKLPSGA